MRLRSTTLLFLVVGLAFSFVSCASAPPQASPASTPKEAAVEKAPPSVNLLCHDAARAVRFDKIGVPAGEWPVDVALSPRSIWVLFEGGRLVQLSRGGEKLEVQMRFLPGAGWSKLDVDPLDGSVWASSLASLNLHRISPDGQVSVVKLQRKVEGAGGYSGLVVGRDAVYAQPTCAEAAVWRLDRSGKLLGTAFKVPEKPREEMMVSLEGSRPGQTCYSLRLERGAEGQILAWDRETRTTHQVDAEGNWSPSDSTLFANLKEWGDSSLPLKGVDVGESSEQWFFTGVSGGLFFWKGQPVFLGSQTSKEKSLGNDTVLYVPRENGPRELLMACNGFPVRDVATDATSYVALTEKFLILGELAGAPNLP